MLGREGSARDAVHQLKYEGWSRAAEAMAGAMGPPGAIDGPGIVDTGSSGQPAATRAGIQPERAHRLRARCAKRAGGIHLLHRVRETRTQTALSPEARHANVAEAFRAQPVGGLELVLVDHVFTTGATLAAAGAALARAGARRVEAVTFARAVVELEASR